MIPRASLLSSALLVLVASLCFSARAHAQDVAPNKAMATDLFDRGVREMRAGGCERSPVADRARCDAARDAFKRACELYPAGLGALRNLANVEANLGLLASAARAFRELARRAPHDPDPARRLWGDFARQQSERLAARVPHLRIELAGEPPAQLILVLDGAELPEAAWQAQIDLDPGSHQVQAQAPGHVPFELDFELAEGEERTLPVVLQAEPAQPQAARAPAAAAPQPAPRARAHALRGPSLLIAAGGAVLGTGLGVGYAALRKRDAACGDSDRCEPRGLASGRRFAHASTLLTSAGAAALVGGLVWYFVAKKSGKERATRIVPALAPHAFVLEAAGRF